MHQQKHGQNDWLNKLMQAMITIQAITVIRLEKKILISILFVLSRRRLCKKWLVGMSEWGMMERDGLARSSKP